MKKYMIVALIDGEMDSYFTDSYDEACGVRLDVECGMGGQAEIYERLTTGDGLSRYVLLEN